MYRHNPRSSTRRVNAPHRSRAHYASTYDRDWETYIMDEHFIL